jgi:GNAT superfamily N-acetyltransferase
MSDLPFPPLNPLRVASPRDILRIGVVAACGFSYAIDFDWERPYHTKYPKDTLLSFRKEVASFIKSPKHIVLVALDKYDPEEGKKSKAVIPPDKGAKIPGAGDEVVVGVVYLRLEPGSKRIGQFSNDKGMSYTRLQVSVSNTSIQDPTLISRPILIATRTKLIVFSLTNLLKRQRRSKL